MTQDAFWSYYKNIYTIYSMIKIMVELVIVIYLGIRIASIFSGDICPGYESKEFHNPEKHLHACSIILLVIHAYDGLRMSYLVYIR
jgi:hypothetical protein